MARTEDSLWFAGRVWNTTAFGAADAKIAMHIAQHYYDLELQPEPFNSVGCPPFTVIVKINGNVYRTITGITGCTNPDDLEDYNCIIENLPPGIISVIVSDSTLPEPLDARGYASWNAVSPPYATLNGSVNALGFPTDVTFEYGLTTSYEYVAQFGVVNGIEPTLCSLQLSSGGYNSTSLLLPGTTYHYRITATNVNGTSYGEDMTFTTPPALPIAITLPATNVG